MKIVHIIPSLKKGGAERLCLDICNALSKVERIQVRLITFSYINEYSFLTEGIDWKVIPANVKLSIFRKNQYYISELQNAINEFKPNIIHTHLFEAEIISRFCHYPSAKWFSHCHDNMVQFRNISPANFLSKQALTNYYEKKVLLYRYKINEGNHFIAISKDTEAYFKETAKPYLVTLLPNAIDYHKFHNPKPENKPGNILRLVNIGSFIETKNQGFLLKVASILKKRSIPFELHLLGDGAKKTALEIRAKNFGLGRVFFHGLVDRVEEILWESHIYVHSALSEGLSLTTLEAMAAGLPVVTLDGKGNRDLIIQGKNGFMIFEQDAQQFANKIIEIWQNKTLFKEMSVFAQEFARKYDIKDYVDRLLEVYKQAL